MSRFWKSWPSTQKCHRFVNSFESFGIGNHILRKWYKILHMLQRKTQTRVQPSPWFNKSLKSSVNKKHGTCKGISTLMTDNDWLVYIQIRRLRLYDFFRKLFQQSKTVVPPTNLCTRMTLVPKRPSDQRAMHPEGAMHVPRDG